MYAPNKRVDNRHDYPNGKVEENRDPRRFNSLEEAEQFAKNVRRTNRIFRGLYDENTEEMAYAVNHVAKY